MSGTTPNPPPPPSGPPPPPPPTPPPPPPPPGGGGDEPPTKSNKRKLLWAGLGVLAVLVVIGLALGDSNDETATENTTTSTAQPSVTATTPTTQAPTTTTAAPTTTTTLPEPVVLQGSGDAIEVLAQPLGTGQIVTMTHTGGSNFAIWAESDQGDRLQLLVNDIGTYTGTVLYEDSSPAALLNITAGGPWTIEIKSIRQARLWDGSEPVTGTGDDVIGILGGLPGLEVADVTHSGSSNFAVWAFSDNGRRELLINEIGPYTGSVRLVAGTLVVAVKAGGDWAITPR